jgi:hypothetical protein
VRELKLGIAMSLPLLLDRAPDHVELALEGVLVVLVVRARCDEDLPDDGLDRGGARAGHFVVHRDVAPAEEGLAVVGDGGFDELLDRLASAVLPG